MAGKLAGAVGWIASLRSLAPWLGRLQRLTAGWGSDRSAMIVRLFGERCGQRVERRWTLVAEHGNGPEIPALSVPPLVERILAGEEQAGARDAGQSLCLEDYAAAFAALSIRTAVEEFALAPSLYQRLMGPRFDRLPASVQAMHRPWRETWAEGEAEVTGGGNRPGALIARAMRFPAPGHHSLQVRFAARRGTERWTRDFSGRRFSSVLSAQGGTLVERFGPLRFHFDLASDDTGLSMDLHGWSVLGVPLPLVLAPNTIAREWEESGRFCFDVAISLPLLGHLVRYRGWLAEGSNLPSPSPADS